MTLTNGASPLWIRKLLRHLLEKSGTGQFPIFIGNHFTTAFALTMGFLRGGRLRPPLWCPFRVCDRVQNTTFRQNMQPIRNI